MDSDGLRCWLISRRKGGASGAAPSDLLVPASSLHNDTSSSRGYEKTPPTSRQRLIALDFGWEHVLDKISVECNDGNRYISCIDEEKEKKLALHRAARRGHASQIQGAAWATESDVQGRTALHVAIDSAAPNFRASQWRIMRLLLAQGANVDARDAHNLRPLHYACRKGDCFAIKLLLEAGAKEHIPGDGAPVPLNLVPPLCQDEAKRIFREMLGDEDRFRLLCIMAKSENAVEEVLKRAKKPKCKVCNVMAADRCRALESSDYPRWLYFHSRFPS